MKLIYIQKWNSSWICGLLSVLEGPDLLSLLRLGLIKLTERMGQWFVTPPPTNFRQGTQIKASFPFDFPNAWSGVNNQQFVKKNGCDDELAQMLAVSRRVDLLQRRKFIILLFKSFLHFVSIRNPTELWQHLTRHTCIYSVYKTTLDHTKRKQPHMTIKKTAWH